VAVVLRGRVIAVLSQKVENIIARDALIGSSVDSLETSARSKITDLAKALSQGLKLDLSFGHSD
jgi:CheY-specific phosphatase CheX